jgi:L-asparaginase II
MAELLVENVRGETVESRHRVSVAVVDAGDRLRAQAGEPHLVAYLRSAAKPFQAIPLVADGVVDRFSITREELALTCASHSSEPDQVERVRGLLERIGCTETDLACGPHRPLWHENARLRAGEQPAAVPRSPIASNCSGKHAGMLALARHHGWPTKGYHLAGHPVQRRVLEEISRFSGVLTSDIAQGVDGCGVVTFAVPISGLARAYARLAASDEPAACTIVETMRSHPELVAGRGRLCTALMRKVPHTLSKVGADGVYGAALLDRRIGIGIKVEDGNSQASVVALIVVLGQLGVEPTPAKVLPEFAEWPYTNTRGEQVGVMRALGRLAVL